MKIIDIHTHGIEGFDTRTASAEHIRQIAGVHGRSGVSQIVPAVYPSSIKTMRKQMHAIKKAMEIQAEEGGRKEDEAEISGMYLEGPFLNPAKCGALDPASFIEPDLFQFAELIEGYEDLVKIITVAPELPGALKLIKDISRRGMIASMGHSDASYAEAEAGYRAGARGITHIFNAMRGIHHREPGIAGFGLMNQDIYIELIADPFHIDARMIEFIFSIKNHDRIVLISDTVRESMMLTAGEGGVADKQNRLLGGSMTVGESSKNLVRTGLEEGLIMKAVSENPARYLYQK